MEGLIDRDALTRYVDRVLVLHNERKTINTDIGEVYEEAKSAGFVTKIIRQIVREKQMDAEERSDHYALLDTYRHALGMLADTPLGKAAMMEAMEAEAQAQQQDDTPHPTRQRRKTFAEQPVHRPRGHRRQPDLVDDMIDTANRARPRGRPRKAKDADEDTIGEPAGAA